MSMFLITALIGTSFLCGYYFGYAEGHTNAMNKVRRRKP